MKADYTGRLKKAEWEIRPLAESVGRELIARYHYAGGTSTAVVYCHGLFKRGELWENNCQGVAWWLPPIIAAAKYVYPENPHKVLALSRLVILPGVPKNACTFFLTGSMKMIDRKVWPCLLTYADTWRGHTGNIYRAANWEYRGMTKPVEVWTKDGKVVSTKSTVSRTRKQMLELGCVCEGKFPKHRYVHIARSGNGLDTQHNNVVSEHRTWENTRSALDVAAPRVEFGGVDCVRLGN